MEGLVFWIVGGLVLVFLVRRTKRKAREATRPRGSTDVRPGVRRVSFDYVDRKGGMTTREITAHRYRDGKVIGYCHLRRAERTFFVDSIDGPVVDAETGELLDVRAWARSL